MGIFIFGHVTYPASFKRANYRLMQVAISYEKHKNVMAYNEGILSLFIV